MDKFFYELTYIVNPVLDDDKIKETVAAVHNGIDDSEGEVVETNEWGLRSLAYDIDGKSNGYYVNLYMQAPASAIEPIERSLRLDDNVMRFLTLKYDAKMLRHYKLKTKGELPVLFEESEEEEEEN